MYFVCACVLFMYVCAFVCVCVRDNEIEDEKEKL